MKPIALASRSVFATLTLALATSLAYAGKADGHDHKGKEFGAHVHGVAMLNVALEGDELHIELDSPAANIVGFEHKPKTEKEHAALAKAFETAKQGERLFDFGDEANCKVAQVQLSSPLQSDHEAHEKHGEHKKHGHHDHEAKHHDEHDDEAHSDVRVVYEFTCSEPQALKQIAMKLFDALPRLETLNVQYVVGSKQGAAQLSASNPVLGL